MTIADAREKCKGFLAKIPPDMLILGVLVLTSSASFGLGYLTCLDAGAGVPVSIVTEALSQSIGDASTTTATSAAGRVVASKNGTKYYPAGCAGANRISPANKVWFASAAAATNAGYALAANCK